MKKHEESKLESKKLGVTAVKQLSGAQLQQITGGRTRQKELLTVG